MLIDWFTVGAQAVNFLILIWLMHRFLYQPILKAIDAREQGIATKLADADKRQAEATREHEEYAKKNSDFDGQRAALLKTATDEAVVERKRLLDEARTSADALGVHRQEALRVEARNLHQEIVRRTSREVFAISRKTLADLAGASLDERLVEVFIQRLGGLDAQAKASLSGILKAAPEPVLVRSAHDVGEAQRTAIQDAVNRICSASIPLHYASVPDLIGGLELVANGQKVAWSIADHLAAMEHDAERILQPDAAEAAQPAPR